MNPIDYIEKCTLEDLLEYRRGTVFLDKNKIERNGTRLADLFFISRVYLGCTDFEISEKFGKSQNTVKSQISIVSHKGITYRDRVDDLVKEIAYWKYKQLNNLNGSKI